MERWLVFYSLAVVRSELRFAQRQNNVEHGLEGFAVVFHKAQVRGQRLGIEYLKELEVEVSAIDDFVADEFSVLPSRDGRPQKAAAQDRSIVNGVAQVRTAG